MDRKFIIAEIRLLKLRPLFIISIKFFLGRLGSIDSIVVDYKGVKKVDIDRPTRR